MCRLQIPNNTHADSEGGGLAIYLILRAVAQNPSIYLILGTTPPTRAGLENFLTNKIN